MKYNKRTQEKTLVLIKPDGVQRALMGEIIKRYERSGLKLIAMKFIIPTVEQVKKHYLIDKGWLIATGTKTIQAYEKHGEKAPYTEPKEMGLFILDKLKSFLTSGPVVAMIWQGNQAVGIVRKITGSTEPLVSDVGTIRGDFTMDSYPLADEDQRAVRNLVHASCSSEDAKKEIKIWFKPKEILNYSVFNEKVLYDVNLDGIKE